MKEILLKIRSFGLLNVVAIAPEGSGIAGATFEMPAQVDDAVAWVLRMNATHNMHFTVNPVREVISKKPTKSDILQCDWVWVDMDPDPAGLLGMEHNDFIQLPAETKKQAFTDSRDKLLTHKVLALYESTKPLIVDSGNGLGAFWPLAEPVSNEECESINRRLVKKFGGDPNAVNADRLMRLPGTWNYASKSKIYRGYPSEPSRASVLAPGGNVYRVEELAAWLPPVTTQESKEVRSYDGPPISVPEVQEIIDHIGAEEYDDWLSVGMGLHHKFKGSDEGMAIWGQWSMGSDKYPGTRDIAYKWHSFDRREGKILSFATVCDMAKAAGANLREIARRHRGQDAAAVFGGRAFTGADLVAKLKSLEAKDVEGLTEILVAAHGLDALSSSQVRQAAKAQKERFGVDARAIDAVKPAAADRAVLQGVTPVSNPTSLVDVATRYIWMREEDRWFDRLTRSVVTTYSLSMSYGHLCERGSLEGALRAMAGLNEADSRTFIPGDSRELVIDGMQTRLNTWTPQGLAPVQGDVTPWLDLVEHVIADEAQREYTLDWQAYTLQYQNVKINHALVVGGEPRTGKDTMFEPLKRGIGDRYHADVNGTKLASEYEDYAVGKKLVTMSEVRFQGEASEDRLKTWTAAPPVTIRLRRLGKPDVEQPNLLALILFTNRMNSLTLGSDPSRYYCIWSSAKPLQDEYYKKLWEWYEGGGCAFVLDFLMRRDVSHFKPKTGAPETPWRGDLKESSFSDERVILDEIIEELTRDVVSTDLIRTRMQAELGRSPGRQALASMLREAGCLQKEVKGPADPVTGKRTKRRLWVVRNHDRWTSASHAELITESTVPIPSPSFPGGQA